MDYLHAIDISASGMDLQRLRLEIIASNLANANSVRSANGYLYKPREVIATTSVDAFPDSMVSANQSPGLVNAEVVEKETPPRLVYDPGSPQADEDGFVAMPTIDLTNSMVDMLTATRLYEANVKVVAAARLMALRALEIGE